MSTEIKTWQIIDGKLKPLQTSLKDERRNEPYDLEPLACIELRGSSPTTITC